MKVKISKNLRGSIIMPSLSPKAVVAGQEFTIDNSFMSEKDIKAAFEKGLISIDGKKIGDTKKSKSKVKGKSKETETDSEDTFNPVVLKVDDDGKINAVKAKSLKSSVKKTGKSGIVQNEDGAIIIDHSQKEIEFVDQIQEQERINKLNAKQKTKS